MKRVAALRAGPFPELLVVALATFTRFWRLGYHSIWFDEAVSLKWSMSDAAWIWQKTFPLLEEKHPPAYYLLLHYWQEGLAFLGLERNDVALRASGALLGVLTVAGLMLLVRRLADRPTALLAALFAALSPVLVWYSQELRMFQPATTALIWGGYCLVRACEGRTLLRRLLWWLAMIVAFVAAFYSYLFSAFLLPAAGLSLLALWATSLRNPADADRDHLSPRAAAQRLAEGIAAFVLVALLFLPLAQNAWGVNSNEGTPGTAFANAGETLLRQLRIFSIWRPDWPTLLEWSVIVLFGALALIGLFAPQRGRAVAGQVWLLLWVGIPLLIGNLLLATTDSVFGEDRYFLFLGPFLLWAAARGLVVLAQRARSASILSGGALVIALAAALPVLWTPALHREQWRAAADLITQQTAANRSLSTTVINHVDYTHMPFEWYARQRLSFDELPIYFPFGGRLDESQIESVIAPPLAGVESAGFDTLWLTQSHLEGMDDSRLVERWLNQRYPLISEAFPAGIRVTGYAIRSSYEGLPDLPAEAARPAAELAPGLTLAACEVTTRDLDAREETLHPPSGWVHLRLWWQVQRSLSADYTARVQVANEEGVWGLSLERPGDTLHLLPTSSWQTGHFVRHELDVNMNPLTPAGEYPIAVRLADSAGSELPAIAQCGSVRINR